MFTHFLLQFPSSFAYSYVVFPLIICCSELFFRKTLPLVVTVVGFLWNVCPLQTGSLQGRYVESHLKGHPTVRLQAVVTL